MRKITVENYSAQKEYRGIVAVVAQVLSRQRFVAPVDVFLGLGLLGEDELARWKRGEVDYLERVIRSNLSKSSAILRILRFHAHDLNLGPSIARYLHRKKLLRFSKTGAPAIEEAYPPTHYRSWRSRRQAREIAVSPTCMRLWEMAYWTMLKLENWQQRSPFFTC